MDIKEARIHSDEYAHLLSRVLTGQRLTINALADEVERLRATLADIVASIEDYERVNNLSPNPPRMSCWDCVATAKTLLTD